MVRTLGIAPGCLIGDHCRRNAFCQQRLCLGRSLSVVLGKGHGAHGERVFLRLLYRVIQMEAQYHGQPPHRLHTFLRHHQYRGAVKGFNQEARQHHRRHHAVRLRLLPGQQYKAGNDIHQIARVDMRHQTLGRMHRQRLSGIVPSRPVQNTAHTVPSRIQGH